jgi:putative flippase GtrA
MLKKLWNYKKVRFLCVGCFNTLVDLTTLNTLVFAVHLPIWLSNTISVSFGITLSYFLNHIVVFRHHRGPNFKIFAKFFLATGASVVVLQTVIIYLTKPLYTKLIQHSHTVGLLHLESKLSLNAAKLTAVLIGMVWNYVLYSRVVFKNKLQDHDEAALQKVPPIV